MVKVFGVIFSALLGLLATAAKGETAGSYKCDVFGDGAENVLLGTVNLVPGEERTSGTVKVAPAGEFDPAPVYLEIYTVDQVNTIYFYLVAREDQNMPPNKTFYSSYVQAGADFLAFDYPSPAINVKCDKVR